MSALHGVRVVDLSRVLAGPFATMILADLGAEVIKVEPPGGDETRSWGPPYLAEEMSAYYLTVNRGKRSIIVDFNDAEALQSLKQLIRTADVVVENFKPGTLKRWGLDWDTLKRDHPSLIYASISGFGETGPERERPGYDFIVQAMGGLMTITGQHDGPPLKVGVAVSDLAAGFYTVIGILAALWERARSGEGQHIDTSLLDATVTLLANTALNYFVSGNEPVRCGNAHPNIVPYEAFEAEDGLIVVAVGNDRQFRTFCRVIHREDLALNPSFSTNRDRVMHRSELVGDISRTLKTKPARYWEDVFTKAGIPIGRVLSFGELFSHPQILARDMVKTLEHPTLGSIPQLGSALKFSRTPVMLGTPPPLPGEHTEVILEELRAKGEDRSKDRSKGEA
ncbi:MAG: L-carnitine dehydratase/bile acid-inducible protein F [Candidatus Carbobacillus altaicus]|uniref:L-carnitine dehydratase/bile acid-inducible protein F n=1 Tax=Candidatus Carbonibacillus altaicus TaxID=2163959 RepID=A0A2R6Y035_9BACL|nr:MAG: L-carnitine dehydratase/bile acid-inducible protein F [Candidatus Carbobacillus altaicus]